MPTRHNTAGRWLRALACVAAVAALHGPRDASAQDVWRRPHQGVRHIHRRVGSLDWHLVSVDLTNPRVRIVGTPESMLEPSAPGRGHRWRTTSQFARAVGADIAVNANYYDIFHGAFTTCGLTVTGGRVWSSAYADRRLECWASVGFGSRGRIDVFDSRGKVYGPVPHPWMTEVVTGSPRVLADGEVLSYTWPRHALLRNPRTLVGASADRRTLYLMVVNGREGSNKGMTCPEAARILRDFGASDAVNLDGGGSSALYIRAEGGLVTGTPDGAERTVGNHLGIVLDADEPEAPEEPHEAPRNVARAAVALPDVRPLSRGVMRAGGPGATRRELVRAGCQSSPGPVAPEASWAVLALTVLVVVSRRSPRDD